jgi:hypothetical protein
MWISFVIQSDCVLKKFLNFLKIKIYISLLGFWDKKGNDNFLQ